MNCQCCNPKPVVWETKMVAIPQPGTCTSSDLESILDTQGWDGWNLAGTALGYFILQRPRKES